jgi:hypothetical protein
MKGWGQVGGGRHDQQNIQKLHFCLPQLARSQHSTLGKTGDSGLRKPAPQHLLFFILSNLTAYRIIFKIGTMLQKICVMPVNFKFFLQRFALLQPSTMDEEEGLAYGVLLQVEDSDWRNKLLEKLNTN